MNCDNASDLRDYLWEKLGLADRSIVFYVLDIGDGMTYFRPGLIATRDDLAEDDGFYDVCEACSDCDTLHVFSAETFTLGDGESDNASYDDILILEETYGESPDVMDALMRDAAESLYLVSDFDIDNPAYDPDEGEEE